MTLAFHHSSQTASQSYYERDIEVHFIVLQQYHNGHSETTCATFTVYWEVTETFPQVIEILRYDVRI